MKEEKIKVLALLPMKLPKEIELDNTLEAMQKFVGGLIEYNDIFRIPNKEVSQEYVNALSTMNWHGVTASDIQKIANA